MMFLPAGAYATGGGGAPGELGTVVVMSAFLTIGIAVFAVVFLLRRRRSDPS